MNTSLLRKLSIGIASLALSSIAFAAMDMDSRVTQLENQMQQVRTKTPMGTYGAQTAIARPEVDGYGWFLSADILVWHPKVGGTDFYYKVNSVNATSPIKGQVNNVSFDWQWGLRVGLGYNFEHDGWDFGFKYTYFKPDDTEQKQVAGDQSLVPLKGSTNIPNLQVAQGGLIGNEPSVNTFPAFRVAALARNQFDITYHNLDLELGRAGYTSGNLSFRPHWGVRTMWLDLESKKRYNGTPSCPDTKSVVGLNCNDLLVEDDSDFWGLGPRAGVDSKWYLGNGVSIFGNVAATLLFGFFDVEHCESTGFISAIMAADGVSKDVNKNRIRLDADRHAVVPTLQMFVGLRYDTYLNENKQHIGVALGYEVNYFWRINQMLQVNDLITSNYDHVSEDIAFYGVTFSFKLDF